MSRIIKLIAVFTLVLMSLPQYGLADRLPTPEVDYRADIKVGGLEGSMRIFKRGDMVRTEITNQEEEIVSILDSKNNESIVLREEGGQKIALISKIDPEQTKALELQSAMATQEGLVTRRAGSDEVIGIPCDVYEVSGEFGEEKVEGDFCFSKEGILLRAVTTDVNSKKKESVEVTSLQVGEQDIALFSIPEGYQRRNLDREGVSSFAE